MIKIKYEKLSIMSSAIGISIFIFVLFIFIFNSSELYLGRIDPNIWGQFGSTIGGILGPIFSLCAIFLLLENIQQQRRTTQNQEQSIKSDQIENRFFQLVSYHKHIVREINSLNPKKKDTFKRLLKEYHKLYNMVDGFYNNNIKRDKDTCMKIIQISYILFFYGYDKNNSSSVKNIENWISIITGESQIPSDLSIMFDAIQDTYKDHQSQLSHYYRNLFQTVKYINRSSNSILDYQQKYDYVKIIRAQLSNYEQALLFYNSISSLGTAWELESDKAVQDQLITKYNMIKNLPVNILKLDPKLFYPDVNFEYDSAPTNGRLKLLELYK